ncbi:hypothetical protein BD311DRAFT_468825 [Dichomitus squalens]|uniref:Uncharacterized protein n=1 Tax=Dichomitus squalens TaxID=114155 RepID=A0A4Q9MJ55_9APHY|nr:hypothetical protein BD311DRAFT_468825 [Dichomitus squalens]
MDDTRHYSPTQRQQLHVSLACWNPGVKMASSRNERHRSRPPDGYPRSYLPLFYCVYKVYCMYYVRHAFAPAKRESHLCPLALELLHGTERVSS